MEQLVTEQIEQGTLSLPIDQQLRLISRLVQHLREKVSRPSDWRSQLEAMSQDEDIQRELREMEAEFGPTENDGLDEL
jgi:hypothetical protein